MKLLDILGISQESIDFQFSNNFGKELEFAIESYQVEKIKAKDADKSEQKNIIESIIKKYTNLNVNLLLNSELSSAAIDLPVVHRNHLFLYDEFKKYYKQEETDSFFNKIKELNEKHTINLKTGKVTGIFSTMVTDLHLNLSELFSTKLTAKHITAVLLHEIGHLFTLYEFIARQNSTNQVLANVFKTVLNKDSIKEREFIFEQAGEILCKDKRIFKELVNQSDLKVITPVIYKKTIEYNKSELGSGLYDFVSCEQLADQYATRQGYGRDLIEALDLLSISYGSPEKSKNMAFFSAFMNVVATSISIFSLLFSAMFGIIELTFFSGLLLFILLSSAGSSSNNYTYDILKVRYLRIKEQLIQRIKDKSIDQKEVKIILNDIKQIEIIIEKTYEIKLPLDKVFDYIFSKDKHASEVLILQRNLEVLAMNNFFVKSATLATI